MQSRSLTKIDLIGHFSLADLISAHIIADFVLLLLTAVLWKNTKNMTDDPIK